jgi:hypothetical protein
LIIFPKVFWSLMSWIIVSQDDVLHNGEGSYCAVKYILYLASTVFLSYLVSRSLFWVCIDVIFSSKCTVWSLFVLG